MQAFFDAGLHAFGKLDVLVNDAGVGASQSASLDTPYEEFRRIIDVDLIAPWLPCQAAAKHMLAHGGGSVVNIRSVHEEISLPGSVAYDAAKAGLRSVTRNLELAARGVRINNVAPGLSATPLTARQKEVAQRGAQVMPFSVAATTHIFMKTADGGIQQIVTKRHDPKQVALIRAHLASIARRFAAGDFEAPEQVHGRTMPGLATLRAAQPGELKVRYRDLRNGGEIAYGTSNPHLVAALHQWSDAQLSDHGNDATAGPDLGMMHHHPADASATE